MKLEPAFAVVPDSFQTDCGAVMPGREAALRPFRFWDLFCGGSGAGSGVTRGISRLGMAPKCVGVNHNKQAIATSRKNNPEHLFLETGVDLVTPILHFPDGAELGWASPSCVFHSSARGGKPINDQERSSAYCVARWAHQTRPKIILVENVPEFKEWGRLKPKRSKKNGKILWQRWEVKNGKRRRVGKETTDVPIQQWSRSWEQYQRDLSRWGFEMCEVKDPKYKGEEFEKWIARLVDLGYMVEWRVLNAADYGDPTQRRRLFVQCVRIDSGLRICWPEPTHAKPDENGKVPAGLRAWRTARSDVLDLANIGLSIFDRKKPLSAKTLRRIRIGLLKYGLADYIVKEAKPPTAARKKKKREPNPFMLPGFGEREGQEPRTHDVDQPTPAITAQGHLHVAQPFILPQQRQGRLVKSVDEPVSPITAKGAEAIVTPSLFLVQGAHGNTPGKEDDARRSKSVDSPLPGRTGSPEFGLASSALIKLKGTGTANSADEPIGAIGAQGQHHGLMTSVVRRQKKEHIDGVCLIQTAHEGADESRVKSIAEPVRAVNGNRGDEAMVTFKVVGIVPGGAQEAILHWNGLLPGGVGRPVLEVGDECFEIEVFFRMLTVIELAKAQGFPRGYQFCGTKTDAIKQIGNAVPGRLAEALTLAAVSQRSNICEFLEAA